MQTTRPLVCILPVVVFIKSCCHPVVCQDGNSENVKQFQLKSTMEPSKDIFHIKHPSSSTSASSFSIVYDVSRRSPKWVMEHLRKPSICEEQLDQGQTEDDFDKNATLPQNKYGGSGDQRRHRRPSFHVEHAIDERKFRTKSAMYSKSGYDRGHLVPAAHFKDCQDMYRHTFSMANVCPQARDLNRGIWKHLEAWTTHLARENDEVVVITGPAYLPTKSKLHGYVVNIKTIGSFPNLIHVPTHFYKIILTRKCKPVPSMGDSERVLVCCAAFLIPNIDNVEIPQPCSYYSIISGFLQRIRVLFMQYVWNESAKVDDFDEVSESLLGLPSGNSRTHLAKEGYASSFEQFVVKIEDLEALVGLKFFKEPFGDIVPFFDSCVRYECVNPKSSTEVVNCCGIENLLYSQNGEQTITPFVVNKTKIIEQNDSVYAFQHLCEA